MRFSNVTGTNAVLDPTQCALNGPERPRPGLDFLTPKNGTFNLTDQRHA